MSLKSYNIIKTKVAIEGEFQELRKLSPENLINLLFPFN